MFLKALINNVKHLFTRNQQKPKDSNNQSPWDNLSLGDRMKLYESFFTGSNFPGKYPYWPSRHCVRIPSEWHNRFYPSRNSIAHTSPQKTTPRYCRSFRKNIFS